MNNSIINKTKKIKNNEQFNNKTISSIKRATEIKF